MLQLARSALFATVQVMLLSSCEFFHKDDGERDFLPVGPGYETFVPTKLLTAADAALPPGEPLANFDTVLADEAKTRGALGRMGPNTGPAPLGQLIAEIRQGGGGSGFEAPGLTGVGGIAGHAFLDAAEQKLNGLNWSPLWTTSTESEGRITDYAYDSGTGGGRLHVETLVTTTATHQNPQVPPRVSSKGYKFNVRIDGGFAVKAKTPTGSPHYDSSDVFPNTGLRIDAGTASGYNFKLYATGTSIRIERVWVDNNGDGVFHSTEEILPSSTGWKAQYKNLLEEGPANCIDLMFAQFGTTSPFIPTTYQELVNTGGPPQYCLGRCGNPPLINTR